MTDSRRVQELRKEIVTLKLTKAEFEILVQLARDNYRTVGDQRRSIRPMVTYHATVPDLPLAKWGDELPTPEIERFPKDKLKWSGGAVIPVVGEIVDVTMNGMGRGEVVGYFIESHGADLGFLGVMVQLAKPPLWLKKQDPVGYKDPAHIFGAEMRPLAKQPRRRKTEAA